MWNIWICSSILSTASDSAVFKIAVHCWSEVLNDHNEAESQVNTSSEPEELNGRRVRAGLSSWNLPGIDLEASEDLRTLEPPGEPWEPFPQLMSFTDVRCWGRGVVAINHTDALPAMNMCQFREAAFSKPQLRTRGRGPCKAVPIIKVPPQSQVNGTGSSLMFLCEVFAFPMALVEWRKEGRDVILPGDDPHISVQSRGGPLRFELSSWLQIEGAAPEDSGTYRCVARNNLGSVSASAVLGVLGAGELSSFLANVPDQKLSDYDQDFY